jgi:hypothetical protein
MAHSGQELIALASLEFFSKDWEQVGNKTSLERHIHKGNSVSWRKTRLQSYEGLRSVYIVTTTLRGAMPNQEE